MRTAANSAGTGAQSAGADIERLRDEVAGLRRALESRATIEQAKGVLMQRHGWADDQAFQHLVRLSQHLNIKLATLAQALVDEAASARSVEPTDEAWAYRLLDLLAQPAMTVRPVPGSTVRDFDVDYANPATVDPEGRTADQLVGRRLSKLYPSAPTSGILAACLQAWHTAHRYVNGAPPFEAAPAADDHRSEPMRELKAIPFLGRVLVTW